MPTYAGKPTCECGAKWFRVFDRMLATYGVKVRYTQLIGGYGPSAGTHSGGAMDLVIAERGKRSLDGAYTVVVRIARRMGADASWERPANWDGKGGIRHVHGLLTGCPHHSWQAKGQIAAVNNGRNGLANNGPDTGRAYAAPGPRITRRTWRQGIAWAEKQLTKREGTFMGLTDAQQANMYKWLKEVTINSRLQEQRWNAKDGVLRLFLRRIGDRTYDLTKDVGAIQAELGQLDDAEVKEIATVVNDEAARRAAVAAKASKK